ncbi:MAG: glycoside hydrolase family 65 [Verrucomicrobiales bacterium]|nr:glycoside hydrolase family 65 [Verrucomicrobiales bacterium]
MDRFALVTRHNVHLTKPDPLTPLSVGNGEFCFTADITGLQSFPEFHANGMYLSTQSQWGWHTTPDTGTHDPKDATALYEVDGRKVPYLSGEGPERGYSRGATWLRANPHRLDLGRIGLRMIHPDGTEVRIDELKNTSQTLKLWKGELTSRFRVDGQPVKVVTLCHPDRDLLAVHVKSPLLKTGRLQIRLDFPYGRDDWKQAADWNSPERHTTMLEREPQGALFKRMLDADRYFVRAAWSGDAELKAPAPHSFELSTAADSIDCVFAFAPTEAALAEMPDFAAVFGSAARHWEHFWNDGAAVDFSGSTDPRADELERRVVLSQYLTAIQCAGSLPPQETGLTGNSWYGKFHLEMHWWHAVQFALWNRLPLLERSLPWYESILPQARATAEAQGYDGVRWPKMTSPDGRDSPSEVGVFLIWQQPHPIYYAELCHRAHPDRATLERYQQLVFETADFMASYPVWDEPRQRFVLGPALIPAQESYGSTRRTNLNPTFELAYWHWGLATAQRWRERLGLERNPKWDHVLTALPQPHVQAGIYTGIETPPCTIRRDHPSMVAALGFLPPTPLIDADIMSRTFDDVLRTWDWPSTWGWDYPMLAMTAARLGRPEDAVSALFLDSPKNRFLANGHNYQSPRLPLYLPGNGGLLTAVAMMAAGWDGAHEGPAPGFPKNGQWRVRQEGLLRMP